MSKSRTIGAEAVTDRFRRACVVTAVIIGCLFSGFQILHDLRVPALVAPGIAARVNGRSIDVDSVNRTVAGMDARDKRSESAARRDVLSRMVDEELLVQHALDTGAAETNPEVRAALVRSAITRVNSEAAAEPIADRELQEYFKTHAEAYATSAQLDVTPFYFESHARAEAARAQLLANIPVDRVLATADPLPFTAPVQAVTPRTLANYYGPELVEQLSKQSPGGTTSVVALGNGVVFLRLNQVSSPRIPSLHSVRDLVVADALRERQEQALESLLTSLRKSARVEFFARRETPVPSHE